MRRDRREEVSCVKRPRDVIEVVAPVREAAGFLDTLAVGRLHEQPVVGPDEDAPVAVRTAAARRSLPTPGSTTARWTPTGGTGLRAPA